MKNLLRVKTTLLMVLLIALSFNLATSQSNTYNTKLGILKIDSRSLGEDPRLVGNLVRAEIAKFEEFEIIDKYDTEDVISQNNFKTDDCYGARCVIELGKLLNADQMITGSAELIEDKIMYNLKLLDVVSGKMIRSETMEFLNIKNQVRNMTQVMVKALFNKDQDQILLEQLTKQDEFESSINVPDEEVLSLNGPRVGVSVLTGEAFEIVQNPENEGGYGSFPVFSTIGYQFEWKYLNTGNIQALVEFIPAIIGVDKGLIIPSMTILNGLRNNKTGLEIAVGPNFTVSRMGSGYYDDGGIWVYQTDQAFNPTDRNVIKRLDSRGEPVLRGGILFAVGKTFKSGKLNIPLNLYIIPGKKNSHRIGLSAGFNIAK